MQSNEQHSPAQGIGLSVSTAGTSYPTLAAGFSLPCPGCVWNNDCQYKEKNKTSQCGYYIAVLNPRLEHALQLARDVAIALNEYDRTHPPKITLTASEHSKLRRARKNNSKGFFTTRQFKVLCDLYGNKCLCCGYRSRLFLHADHVVPLSRGGDNGIENIQPLCRSCNSRKGTKTIDYRPYQKQECDANNQK